MKPRLIILSFALSVAANGFFSRCAVRAEASAAISPNPTPSTQPSVDSAPQRQRLQARLAKLKSKYGDALRYEIDEPSRLIFATALDDRALDETRRIMAAHARALSRDLFDHPPDDYLSVVIPKSWSNERVTGHFYPPDFLDARTIGSNLKHEFTHALHFADQHARAQEHPVWVMEGLASLYEISTIVDGHSVPEVDGRVEYLKEQIRRKSSLSWEKISHLEHRQFTSRNYSQARYMFMYLYQTGQLKPWYKAYTASYEVDPSGMAAIERVLGKPVAQVEQAWSEWVLKLPVPAANPTPAGLGIEIRQAPDGLEIQRIAIGATSAPATAPEKMGLASGDVIVSIDDVPTIEPQDLAAALARHKPGDRVVVQYRRDGKYQNSPVTLVALSRRAAPPE